MITSFQCKQTEKIFKRLHTKLLPAELHRHAYKKLVMLDAAVSINDLRIPPSNRLEKLSGDREGQFSIRINEKYRICFVWNDGVVDQVEIVDYR